MKVLSALVALIMLSACGFEVVDTGNRGIETRFGQVVGEPLPEGLHFYNPLTSDITEFSVRAEKFEGKTSIFTKDTQRVDVEYTVVAYADPASVGNLYREVGNKEAVESKIINPVVLGSMKDAIGQVIADELVQSREKVTQAALETIRKNLTDRHITVTDLQFTNLDFDDTYENAVEQKVVAIQMANKAKNETVRIEEQAKQTVLSAKAQAESMKIQSQALSQNHGLVEYEAVKKWNGELPQFIMGGGASTPFIDMNGLLKRRQSQSN